MSEARSDAQHGEAIRAEFTRQAQSFGRSAAMTSVQTLDALIELVPEDPQARWIDVACGPGVISCATASRVGSVSGVDLTPAMIEEAGKRAREEEIDNVGFALGDATALDLADGSFDGAITRLSLHHIPAPARVVAEMARLVRPGGWVVVSDLAADRDGAAAAWREEIERLRDPSHWACRTPESLRGMGAAAGLVLEHEELAQVDIDFDDWLERGSGGRDAAPLVAQLLGEQPSAAECFRVIESDDGRRLQQRYWLARWRRPA
jgi:ubiquinone/menaquinone biosynthesis C-methylase UbiE